MSLGMRQVGTLVWLSFRDHGGEWDIRMVLDCLRSLGIRFCQPGVLLYSFLRFGCVLLLTGRRHISPSLSLERVPI